MPRTDDRTLGIRNHPRRRRQSGREHGRRARHGRTLHPTRGPLRRPGKRRVIRRTQYGIGTSPGQICLVHRFRRLHPQRRARNAPRDASANRRTGYPLLPHTTVYEETTSTGSFDPSICNRYTDGFLFLRTTSFLSACSRIYARSFLRRHALRFREGILWEDGEFNVRALGRTKKHYCIDEALYYYIRRSGSISSSNGSNDRRSLDSYLTKIETISEWFADEPLEAEERRTVNKCISDVAIFYAALLPELPAEERRTYRKQLRERIAPNWRTLYRTGSPVQNLVGLGIRFAQPLAERLLQFRLRKALKRR